MFSTRLVHRQLCLSCRLRACILSKQLSRTRKPLLNLPNYKALSTSARLSQTSAEAERARDDGYSPEAAAALARKRFGNYLPQDELNEEEFRVYERLYGRPLAFREREEVFLENEGEDVEGTGVLKESPEGVLEEVEFAAEDGDRVVVKTSADARLVEDMQAALGAEDAELEEEMEDSMSYVRAHPLTTANRFTTYPSTLPLPTHDLVEPLAAQLSHVSNTHLKEHAHRIFGGLGLPWSTSTPAIGKTLQQRPIPLEAVQNSMSEIEADVFMATLLPGMYASIMSSLVETRKRLGTAWAEELVKKAEAGELRVLDAGGAGAGVLAVREVLKREWERIHEESSDDMAVAEADGKAGGSSAPPPLGHATVLAGSDELRRRASLLLENTTFIPRLPNYANTEDAKKKGKFDVVIAPHNLWGLREDYMRRSHLENLWSMLKHDGGVLVLLEKGVARGFEITASAREMLLEKHLRPPTAVEDDEIGISSQKPEGGTIIAPCTNHASCPMFEPQGVVKGRRDICHFSQRYVRPPFLQTVLGAKDKNFEDVKFSYLSIMRGRDMLAENAIAQNEAATDTAFTGFEHMTEEVSSLTLPRAILPPIKRRGHVILDLCTPAGTLERWTVPRSFSKQAFRDARKSSWGDLWALGAKTRVPRVPKIKKRKAKEEGAEVLEEAAGFEWEGDTYGEIVSGGEGGRRRTGRKVKGIREKRDKRGDGNGRRKRGAVD